MSRRNVNDTDKRKRKHVISVRSKLTVKTSVLAPVKLKRTTNCRYSRKVNTERQTSPSDYDVIVLSSDTEDEDYYNKRRRLTVESGENSNQRKNNQVEHRRDLSRSSEDGEGSNTRNEASDTSTSSSSSSDDTDTSSDDTETLSDDTDTSSDSYDSNLENEVAEPRNVQRSILLCAICLEEVIPEGLYVTTCSHSFHYWCLQRWLRVKKICPSCRHEIPNDFFW